MPVTHQSELVQELIKMLGIPNNCTDFFLQCTVNEIVLVECVFMPDGNQGPMITKQYRLEEINEEKE